MNAVKPLIEMESGFHHFNDDLVTVPHGLEDGSLEEALETVSRKTGFGRLVSVRFLIAVLY